MFIIENIVRLIIYQCYIIIFKEKTYIRALLFVKNSYSISAILQLITIEAKHTTIRDIIITIWICLHSILY